MLKKIVASWYFRKKLFVELLITDLHTYLSPDQKIWSYYKLGMYSKVIVSKGDLEDWHILFAKIVSHISLGNQKKAEVLYSKWIENANNKQYNILLAKDLLPYAPKKSFELINPKDEPILYAALLVKLNRKREALKYINKLIEKKMYKKFPELFLYYSNINEFNNSEKLNFLNKYLLSFELPTLSLKNSSVTFNIANLLSNNNIKSIKEGPLVSIIMTAYNSEKTIRIAIESILKQSYINFELIIVDDASKDNTVSIIQQYKKFDNRIKLIKLKENVGTYVAKNSALKQAKGEYVTFHDSDDFSLPIKIEKQILPLLKNKNIIASISNWIRLSNEGKYYSRGVYPLSRLNHSSLMFRKDKVLKKIGFFDSVRTGADSEFFARLNLVFGQKSIIKIKLPLSIGAHRENSLMTSTDTGYNKDGVSLQRQKYWERWREWHINTLSSNLILYLEEGSVIL